MIKTKSAILGVLATSLLLGCGGAATTTTTPNDPSKTRPVADAQPPAGDPFAVTGMLTEEWLPNLKGPQAEYATVELPPTPENVPPPPPAACDAYVAHKAPKTCDAKDKIAALDEAMGVTDAVQRDDKLAKLEACAFEPGVIRVLRAEMAPAECGDAIVLPAIAEKKGSGAVLHALQGHALAARLARAVATPPKIEAPFTKDRVDKFVKGPMMEWFMRQAKAVQDLAKAGSQLSYYGRGLVAIAAGTADLRLVDAVREVPLPEEFKKDPDLTNAYYAALDEALEPRKLRGRDGALVGLKELAHAGLIVDARVTAARKLIAKLFGGRRIDALDTLILPAFPAPSAATPTERLAARLPTFVAGLVLEPTVATDPKVLRAFMEKGLPVPHRVFLKSQPLTEEARGMYAAGRLMMGLRYWRRADFDEAAKLLRDVPAAPKPNGRDRTILALALALRGGPEDGADLMRGDGVIPKTFGDVRALDVVARDASDGGLQGPAAFDAAVISQIALGRGAKPEDWKKLAARYDEAATLLMDNAERIESQERARAAEATAKALSAP